MSNLKPCPWCGKEPEILEYQGEYSVWCSDDESHTAKTYDFGRKSKAIAAWNKRA